MQSNWFLKNKNMTENLYTKNCIRTFTGKYVDPFNLKEEDICIEDIAHSLSMQVRFCGHLPVFYSVAEHCIRVKYCLPKELQLAGILHDASETYLHDMAKPIKDRLPDYLELENKVMKVIAKKFGFDFPLHPDVKSADKKLLEEEWDYIMLQKNAGIMIDGEGPKRFKGKTIMSQVEAKVEFLHFFYNL